MVNLLVVALFVFSGCSNCSDPLREGLILSLCMYRHYRASIKDQNPEAVNTFHILIYLDNLSNHTIDPAGNYMFKVNNKVTRTYFTPCSSVSIVNFEQVYAGWGIFRLILILSQSHQTHVAV